MLLEDLLDSEVNKIIRNVLERRPHDHITYYVLLQVIANHSAGVLITDESFLLLILRDPEKGPLLKEQLAKAWEQQKYQSIRDIVYLHRTVSLSRPMRDYGLQMPHEAIATERAWKVDYVGEAAHALLDHLKKYLPNSKDNNSSGRQLYARYTAIIQSSGMGKSRTIDELAKLCLVVPMVLRPKDSTGYPPADSQVRDYLIDNSPGAFQRILAFLQALFDEVTSMVKTPPEDFKPWDRSRPFAEQFRTYMSHGMTMTSHGRFRVQFYDKVVEKARMTLKYKKAVTVGSDSTQSDMDAMTDEPSFPLNVSLKELLTTVEVFPRNQPSLVILSFDDLHILEEHYVDFRRAFRALWQHPVFSIFLATSGHMFELIRNPTRDPLSRMDTQGWAIPPFSEIGFDHHANDNHLSSSRDVMEVDVTLPRVSSTAQLVRFGRPLWATRYYKGDAGVQNGIILFAAAKLLGGIDPSVVERLDLPQRLGCLAQRLPIEFLSVSYSSSLANPQTLQVGSHLRVVIRVDDELETMSTLSSSEPILSEAAYWLMSTQKFQPADGLKGILGGFSVHSGDRGELLVMLLLTIARDRAVGLANEFGVPTKKARWCSINTFLSSLFVKSPWDEKMNELFGEGKLYFNHFIKVHQFNMLDVKYITRLMARGAAILTATSQKGVDLVIPFILKGNSLTESNMGAILVQVKNDKHYTTNVKPEEVQRMSIEGLSGIPMMRFFFALAAKQGDMH